jgi:hypothetical protein
LRSGRPMLLARYDRDQVRASWREGEGGRLESFIGEIAVEVVTTAEIIYRESCVSAFEWKNSSRPGSIGCSMKLHR